MRNRSGQKLSSMPQWVEGTKVGMARDGGGGGAAHEAGAVERAAAGVSERGGMLARHLWLRRQARHAASIAANLDDADALLIPFVLSLARLGAQRDASEQGQGSALKVGAV